MDLAAALDCLVSHCPHHARTAPDRKAAHVGPGCAGSPARHLRLGPACVAAVDHGVQVVAAVAHIQTLTKARIGCLSSRRLKGSRSRSILPGPRCINADRGRPRSFTRSELLGREVPVDRIQPFSLSLGNRVRRLGRRHDHVVARLPALRSGHLVRVAGLHGLQKAHKFVD